MSQFPLPRILDLVRRVAPFEALTPNELDSLVAKMDVAYFPAGEVILEAGGNPSAHLYIIQSGTVRLWIPDEDEQELLVDIRGEEDTFGALSLLHGSKAMLTVSVEEDLIAFTLPAEDFRPLVKVHPAFKRHFSFPLARNFRSLLRQADCSLGHITGTESLTEMAVQMRSRVEDLMSAAVLTCSPDDTVQQAAQAMAKRRVGSIVVKNGTAEPVGMVTDADLRCRVLATGLTPHVPVRVVMSSPIMTVSPKAYAFEAMLEMTMRGVHHLVVTDREQMVGVISDHDIKVVTGSSPVGLAQEIDKVVTLDQLERLPQRVIRVMEMLLRLGSSAEYIMAVANEFHDRLVLRLLRLGAKRMAKEGRGEAPCAFSWLAVGRAGRGEQAPPTPLQHALAHQDLPPQKVNEAQGWLTEFARWVDNGLSICELPLKQGGIAAFDPHWCQSVSDWHQTFRSMVAQPDPRTLPQVAQLLDFRPVEGETHFAKTVRQTIFAAIKKNPDFLPALAQNGLDQRPPLGFLREFVVEADGAYSEQLDLHMKVLGPMVNALRVLALDNGIMETSSMARIAGLEAEGTFSARLAADLHEAVSFLVSLLISRFLAAHQQGRRRYFLVDPQELNSAQRKMLKESFAVAERLRAKLLHRFGAGGAFA